MRLVKSAAPGPLRLETDTFGTAIVDITRDAQDEEGFLRTSVGLRD